MRRKRIALVGAGAMGSLHARTVAESARTTLDLVIDTDLRRARDVAGQWGAAASDNISAATACDAVIIATPSQHHAGAASDLLGIGMPLLVEKPLATDVADMVQIVQIADQTRTPLLCGFVERFNPAVTTLQSVMDGPATHTATTRYSPPNPRATGGVAEDLLIHDVDLVLRIMGQPATGVHSHEWTPPGAVWPETVDALLSFPDGRVANVSASRVHQRKIRSLIVATSDHTYEVDLLRRAVTSYRNLLENQVNDGVTTYRAHTVMDIPFVRSAGEPLSLQLAHFVETLGDPQLAASERSGILPPHLLLQEIMGATSRQGLAV